MLATAGDPRRTTGSDAGRRSERSLQEPNRQPRRRLRGQAGVGDGRQGLEVRTHQEPLGRVRERESPRWLSTAHGELSTAHGETRFRPLGGGCPRRPGAGAQFLEELLSSYDQLPTRYKVVGRPNVGNEARLYRSDLTLSTAGPDSTESGYVLVWRSRTVVATMEVRRSSDVEFDGLTKTYVMTLAKRQQARIARATR